METYVDAPVQGLAGSVWGESGPSYPLSLRCRDFELRICADLYLLEWFSPLILPYNFQRRMSRLEQR
jgi:hypothetical protein